MTRNQKFVRTVVVAVAVIGWAIAGFAATKPEGYDDYQTSGDAADENTSYNGPGKWTVLKAAPVAGKRYCVYGCAMYSPKISTGPSPTNLVFAGDELCIAGSSSSWGYLKPLTSASPTFDSHLVISNLVLRPEGRIEYGSQRHGILGRCTLLGTSDASGQRACFSGSMHITKREYVTDHGFDLVGDKDQCLYLVFTGNQETEAGDYAITGSQTNYFGTYRLGTATSLCLAGNVPGTVIVESNALYRTWYNHGHKSRSYVMYDFYQDAQTISNMTVQAGGELEISASNVLTVVNLTLEGGSTVRLDSTETTNGILVVSGKLTVSNLEKGKIKLICAHAWNYETGTPPAYPTVVLGKDATIEGGTFGADLFEFVDDGTVTSDYGLPTRIQTVVAAEDGTQTFVSTRREVVTQVTAAKDKETTASPLSCPQNPAGEYYWSDNSIPQAGKDYLTALKIVLTNDWTDCEGESLTLHDTDITSGNMTIHGALFKKLALYNGSTLRNWAGYNASVSTRSLRQLEIKAQSLFLDGAVQFYNFGNYLYYVNAPFSGTGNLTLTTENGASAAANGRSNFEFPQDNTAWTGKLKMTVATNEKDRSDAATWGRICPTEKIFIKLFVKDGNNLGGDCAELTRDAITIEQYSMLSVVDNDVTYARTNRGITINTIGRFNVGEGKTFTVSAPLTLNGELWKEDAGLLALGGSLAFKGGAADPVATSTNIVRLKAGTIKPLAKDVLNGADIQVEAGAGGFRFDFGPEDSDLAKYGLVDVKTLGAISGESIPVTIDGLPQAMVPDGTKLGLFTLATKEAAETLQSKLALPEHRASSGVRLNLIGTTVEETTLGWTISAVFRPPSGLLLMVR